MREMVQCSTATVVERGGNGSVFMFHISRLFVVFVAFCSTFVLSSCGLPQSVWLRSNNVVSTNDAGESVPVNVRFFQLRHWKKFREASFNDLWADSATTLGDDLLGTPFDFTIYADTRALSTHQTARRQALPQWESGSRYLGAIILSSQMPPGTALRRIIMPVKDAYTYNIVVDNGTITLVDR